MSIPYFYVDDRENQQQRNGRNGNISGDRQRAEQFFPSMERIRLEEGDYVCYGADDLTAAWERKKIKEAIDCVMYTNRHVAQLERCRLVYDVSYLVIEGEFRRGKDGFLQVPTWDRERKRHVWLPTQPLIPYGRFIKSMETLHRQLGVDVIYTTDYPETCARILDLAEWWQTPVEEHTSIRHAPNPFVMLGRANLVTKIVARFGGVGEKMAILLGHAFESPHALDQATVEELVEKVSWKDKNGKTLHMPRKTAERFKRQWYTGGDE